MAFKLPSLSLPSVSLFAKKSYLAVDVGASAVKICRLSGGRGKFHVDLWDSLPMTPGLTGKDFEAKAAELLRQLVSKHKIKQKSAIFCLPAQAVVIRYLTLKGIPKERLEGVVRHEAEGHIPFPLAEVSLDWCEARKTENGYDVLLAAIKQDKLDSMVSIIEEAGLEVQMVDVTTLALFSLYYHTELKHKTEEGGAEVFVDIGAGTTDIAFLKDQRVFFTRSVPIAGRSFTEIISKRLDIPEDKAERMKIRHAEVKAIVADLTALKGDTAGPGGMGLGVPKAPGGGLPTAKAPGLAAPSAGGGLMAPKPPGAGGLTPPSAGGLIPPKPASVGGLMPPSLKPPGQAEATPKDKEIPKTPTEVPLPSPPTLALPKPPAAAAAPEPKPEPAAAPTAPPLASPKPPTLSLPKPPSASAAPAAQATPTTTEQKPEPAPPAPPKPPTLSLPKPPSAPAVTTTAPEQKPGPAPLAPPKPPTLSLPKPPSTPAAPSTSAAPPPPPAAPKPPTLSLPKPPGAAPAVPPAAPPATPPPPPPSLKNIPPPRGITPPGQKPPGGGSSLGAAKAEDGEVFSLFESEDDGQVDKEKLAAAVKPIADRMATELRRSFDYFTGQLGGGDIKKVILSGGGACLKGLAEYLGTQLNVPVVVFDPLASTKPPAGAEKANPQVFGAALGMGMRLLDGTPLDINLIPANIQARRRGRSMGRDLKYLAAAAGLLLAQLGVYAFLQYRNTNMLYEKLQADVRELESVVNQTRQLAKDQKTVNDLEKSIAALVTSKSKWIAVLSALDKTLPENASLNTMSIPSKDEVVLRLIANSLNEIPEIGRRFQSPEYTKNYFTLTNRPSPRKAQMLDGRSVFEVELKLRIDHTVMTGKPQGGV